MSIRTNLRTSWATVLVAVATAAVPQVSLAAPLDLTDVTVTTGVIKISQRIKSQLQNPSSTEKLTKSFNLVSTTKASTATSTENLKEESSNSKFAISSQVDVSYSGASGSASVSSALETARRALTRTVKDTASSKEDTATDKLDYTLGPKEEMTVYTVTEAGPGYVHEYDTNKPVPSSELPVKITRKTDYAPLFNALMQKCVSVANHTNEDKGSWSAYGGVCKDGLAQGIQAYFKGVKNPGWTFDYDAGMWGTVRAAAAKAEQILGPDGKGPKRPAMIYLMNAYTGYPRAASNGQLWAELNSVGAGFE